MELIKQHLGGQCPGLAALAIQMASAENQVGRTVDEHIANPFARVRRLRTGQVLLNLFRQLWLRAHFSHEVHFKTHSGGLSHLG